MNNFIVLLCGGNSIRFHENKLLFELNGKPLFRHTFDKLQRIIEMNSNYSLIVVSQYKSLLDSIDHCIKVYSEDCRKGASYSIKKALDMIKDTPCYITFVVADQPFMKEETLFDFMDTSIKSNIRISCISYKDELFNPVMFHSDYIDDLYSLEKDQGGKRIVHKHLKDVFKYNIENPLELKDIDTKDEL